jgi:hypothetical protein
VTRLTVSLIPLAALAALMAWQPAARAEDPVCVYYWAVYAGSPPPTVPDHNPILIDTIGPNDVYCDGTYPTFDGTSLCCMNQ